MEHHLLLNTYISICLIYVKEYFSLSRFCPFVAGCLKLNSDKPQPDTIGYVWSKKSVLHDKIILRKIRTGKKDINLAEI